LCHMKGKGGTPSADIRREFSRVKLCLFVIRGTIESAEKQ
jgi:hypothetical protein